MVISESTIDEDTIVAFHVLVVLVPVFGPFAVHALPTWTSRDTCHDTVTDLEVLDCISDSDDMDGAFVTGYARELGWELAIYDHGVGMAK
jgi:hypothetical protein